MDTTNRRARRTSARPLTESTCFHSTALSSSCRQMAFGDGRRLPEAVGENRIQITNLAEAVAAELE